MTIEPVLMPWRKAWSLSYEEQTEYSLTSESELFDRYRLDKMTDKMGFYPFAGRVELYRRVPSPILNVVIDDVEYKLVPV